MEIKKNNFTAQDLTCPYMANMANIYNIIIHWLQSNNQPV